MKEEGRERSRIDSKDDRLINIRVGGQSDTVDTERYCRYSDGSLKIYTNVLKTEHLVRESMNNYMEDLVT